MNMWCLVVISTLCSLILPVYGGRTCTTPNGETAQCISIYNCSVLYDVLRDRNPESVRFLRQSQCGFDVSPYVCCGSVAEYQSSFTQPAASSLYSNYNICGIQNDDRLPEDVLTQLNNYIWMALMQYRSSTGGMTFSCGGVLINKRYVLTAAHCVTGQIIQNTGRLVSVRLGEWDTSKNPDCITLIDFEECSDPFVDISVESAVAHPDYHDSSVNRYHDIALVRLSQEVKFTDFIQPICLPTLSTAYQPILKNRSLVVGWGHAKTINSSSIKSEELVAIVENSECITVFNGTGLSLVDTQFCAGGNLCVGDSGGPIMNRLNNELVQWYVEGVGSFDPECRIPKHPGIYTKVSKYLNWIDDNMLP